MALSAEFDGEVWKLVDDGVVLLEYTLDFVPLDYILDYAEEYGIITTEERYVFSQIGEQKQKEVLQWFKEVIWPSKIFGRDLIDHFETTFSEFLTLLLNKKGG